MGRIKVTLNFDSKEELDNLLKALSCGGVLFSEDTNARFIGVDSNSKIKDKISLEEQLSRLTTYKEFYTMLELYYNQVEKENQDA